MLSLNLQSVVGKAERGVWSQSLHLRTEQGEVGVAIRITHQKGSESVLDLGSIGSSVLTKLQEDTASWIQGVQKETEGLLSQGFGIQVVVVEAIRNSIIFWARGGGSVYLQRNKQFAELVGKQNQNKLIKGELKQGDVLVVGIVEEEKLPIKRLAETMMTGEGVAETLSSLVHGSENTMDVAMLVGVVSRGEGGAERRQGWKMPQLKIERLSDEPQRFNLVLGMILIGAILILVVIGGVYKVKRDAKNEFESKRSEVETLITEARSTVESNPERAKILLAQAKEILATYIKENKSEQYKLQAKRLEEDLKNEESALLRVSGATLTTTIELSLIEEGLTATKMETDGEGNVYFVGKGGRELVGVNMSDKSIFKTEINDGKSVSLLAVAKGRSVGVTEEGILEITQGKQDIAIKRDETWGEIGQLGLFGNNIYLLDLGNSEIWKYSALTEGYAERKRWLAAGIVLDLTKVIDWVVDGDVWLLTSSGKLERYSRGAPTKFELAGFPSVVGSNKFSEPVAVSVGEDRVYILERGAKRVVTIGVDGKYLGQKVAEELGRASDMVVYQNKAFVLIDNMIKEFGL